MFGVHSLRATIAIQHFTNLGITAYMGNIQFPYKKLGAKLLSAYETCAFRSLVTSQLVCICHYYCKLKMEQLQMIHLKDSLGKFNLGKDAIVREYMMKMGFITTQSLVQEGVIQQFKYGNKNWLLEQIDKACFFYRVLQHIRHMLKGKDT